MIHITNRQDGPGHTYYCGRGSPVGNPFAMQGESTRDAVCDAYDEWFTEEVRTGGNYSLNMYLYGMLNKVKEGKDISLRCFCYPKRCHCETIKTYLEKENG